MFLLLVSLTTLIQVETSTTSIDIAHSIARKNAQLGMQVALGHLQREAGPDLKVTARADITMDPENIDLNAHPNWTGVWDAQDKMKEPEWLVSGSEPDPSKDLGANSINLVGNEFEQQSSITDINGNGEIDVEDGLVKAPLVKTYNNGYYAYWIGDKGIKAKVTITDPLKDSSLDLSQSGLTESEDVGISRLVVAQSLDIQKLDPILADKTTDDSQSKANFINDLMMVTFPEVDSEEIGEALAKRFHDITTHSKGLLIDMKHGGFKFGFSGGLSPLTSINTFGDRTVNGNRINVHLFPQVILHNPYNVTMAAKDYGVLIGNTPVLSAELSDNSNSGWMHNPVATSRQKLLPPDAPANVNGANLRFYGWNLESSVIPSQASSS